MSNIILTSFNIVFKATANSAREEEHNNKQTGMDIIIIGFQDLARKYINITPEPPASEGYVKWMESINPNFKQDRTFQSIGRKCFEITLCDYQILKQAKINYVNTNDTPT